MEAIIAAILPAAISAIAQIFGAKSAASAQVKGNQQAIAAQLAMFGITQATLAPYLSGGAGAMGILMGSPGRKAVAAKPWILTKNGKTVTVQPGGAAKVNALKAQGWTVKQKVVQAKAAVAAKPGMLKSLIKPISMTQADLEKTPGYQFALGQGLKATGNALTTRGMSPLGSGAGIKGAEQYAVGLASQTYQQQFQNALANKEMAWKALYGTASLGESGATGIGTAASSVGENVSQSLINQGAAQGQGSRDVAAAITGFANNIYTNNLLSNSKNSIPVPGNGNLWSG
jgi:hypothetical protein